MIYNEKIKLKTILKEELCLRNILKNDTQSR